MTKGFIYIIVLFSYFINYSQFSIKTEYDYLKLINFQKDKKLIKSSVINSEIAANNIILENNEELTANFYNELSKSFYIAKEYEKSFYYQILQRIIFTNNNISTNSKERFYDCGLKINLSSNEVAEFWKKTSLIKLPKSKNNQILLSIKLGTQLFSKKLTNQIFDLGLLLKKQDFTMPQWYKDWAYLTTIQLKEKYKSQYINYNTSNKLFERLSNKDKIKLLSKSINYYTKKHAFKNAKQLKNIYKKQHLSFWRKNDLLIKSVVTYYHRFI